MVQVIAEGNPGARRASPGEARSVAALFLAAGANPQEIDGAVQTLIQLSEKRLAPMSYSEVAQNAVDALEEYRRVNIDALPEG